MIGEQVRIRHTDDPDVDFIAADPVMLWMTGITEFRIDRRDKKFLVTLVMRDRTDGQCFDLTESYERCSRKHRVMIGSTDYVRQPR